MDKTEAVRSPSHPVSTSKVNEVLDALASEMRVTLEDRIREYSFSSLFERFKETLFSIDDTVKKADKQLSKEKFFLHVKVDKLKKALVAFVNQQLNQDFRTGGQSGHALVDALISYCYLNTTTSLEKMTLVYASFPYIIHSALYDLNLFQFSGSTAYWYSLLNENAESTLDSDDLMMEVDNIQFERLKPYENSELFHKFFQSVMESQDEKLSEYGFFLKQGLMRGYNYFLYLILYQENTTFSFFSKGPSFEDNVNALLSQAETLWVPKPNAFSTMMIATGNQNSYKTAFQVHLSTKLTQFVLGDLQETIAVYFDGIQKKIGVDPIAICLSIQKAVLLEQETMTAKQVYNLKDYFSYSKFLVDEIKEKSLGVLDLLESVNDSFYLNDLTSWNQDKLAAPYFFPLTQIINKVVLNDGLYSRRCLYGATREQRQELLDVALKLQKSVRFFDQKVHVKSYIERDKLERYGVFRTLIDTALEDVYYFYYLGECKVMMDELRQFDPHLISKLSKKCQKRIRVTLFVEGFELNLEQGRMERIARKESAFFVGEEASEGASCTNLTMLKRYTFGGPVFDGLEIDKSLCRESKVHLSDRRVKLLSEPGWIYKDCMYSFPEVFFLGLSLFKKGLL